MMHLFDSHAHLQHEQFRKDRKRVIERALDAGVSIILNVGYDLESSGGAIKLAEQHEFMYASVGIHPHDSQDLDEAALNALEDMTSHEKVVAIGEIGLDYYRDLSPREAQRNAFERQLELASSVDLPVVVHVREAHGDAVEILKRWGGGDGVMHCFSGSTEEANTLLGLGFKLGLGGSITFGSKRLETIALRAAGEDILVETDCPYLAPRPRRGRNEPAFLGIVCEKIASIRGQYPEDVARVTMSNAKSLFRL
jgi:TatD DNase family protein